MSLYLNPEIKSHERDQYTLVNDLVLSNMYHHKIRRFVCIKYIEKKGVSYQGFRRESFGIFLLRIVILWALEY